ncbi:hypothetical protein TI04_03625 [Achromatium sp. WMS2]|nr:hypothetical protein TI04_03625 [Achromatium sp. WMS2]
MSHVYAQDIPLTIIPARSTTIGTILTALYGITLSCILNLPITWWLRLPLLIVLIALAKIEWGLHISRQSPWAIIRLELDTDSKWIIYLRNGGILPVELYADNLVTTWLIVLNFRPITGCPTNVRPRWLGHNLSLILTTDNCNPTILRDLRVRLRLQYGG